MNLWEWIPVTRYFFGTNFSRADLAGAQEWNMQQNASDVILGAPSFFRVSGGSVHMVGCIAGAWQYGLNSHQKKSAIADFSINSHVLSTGSPQGMAAGSAMQGGRWALFPAPGEVSF